MKLLLGGENNYAPRGVSFLWEWPTVVRFTNENSLLAYCIDCSRIQQRCFFFLVHTSAPWISRSQHQQRGYYNVDLLLTSSVCVVNRVEGSVEAEHALFTFCLVNAEHKPCTSCMQWPLVLAASAKCPRCLARRESWKYFDTKYKWCSYLSVRRGGHWRSASCSHLRLVGSRTGSTPRHTAPSRLNKQRNPEQIPRTTWLLSAIQSKDSPDENLGQCNAHTQREL